MLRWIYGHIKKDRIQNNYTREYIGIAPIKKKIKKKKKQLMWFGYTESHWKLQGRLRRENCIVYSRVKRRRGRLKKNLGRLKENVTRDLMVNNNKLHLCSYWYCCSWRTACKLFYYQHSIIIESPNLQTVY